MIDVQVLPITADQQPILRNLLGLYVYDFSELLGLDVDEEGRFQYGDLSGYWSDPARHPFLVRVEGRLAGFALVQDRSRLSGTEGIHDMAEFFVLRKYRRQGVGERVATGIFDRFRGDWEIRQRANNAAATAFWRRVIDRYTAGNFREVLWDEPTWQGPVQLFSTGAAAPPDTSGRRTPEGRRRTG